MGSCGMVRELRLGLLATALCSIAAACNGATADGAQQGEPVTVAASSALFADPVIGCRFAMPDIGLRVAAEHFDPSSPAQKMKHTIALSGPATQVLRIDVWQNTEGLALRAWFDKYLAFSVNPGATVQSRLVGRARTTAIVVDQKRSPQSQARRIVTFAVRERVFRITCFDSDDAISTDVLNKVLDTFEGEVTP